MYINEEKLNSLEDPEALIVYVHPQRTGGTAFKSILNRVFSREKVFSAQTVKKEQYKSWKDISEHELKSYRVIAGHFNFYPRNLLSRPVVFIGTIRDPYERMRSIYNYCKEKDGHKLQKLALKNTINDFVVEAAKVWPAYICNVQCARFGGASSDQAIKNIKEYFAIVAEPYEVIDIQDEILRKIGTNAQRFSSTSRNASTKNVDFNQLDRSLVDHFSGEDVDLYLKFKKML